MREYNDSAGTVTAIANASARIWFVASVIGLHTARSTAMLPLRNQCNSYSKESSSYGSVSSVLVREFKLSMSKLTTQTPIRQMLTNFRIPYFRPSKCRHPAPCRPWRMPPWPPVTPPPFSRWELFLKSWVVRWLRLEFCGMIWSFELYVK